MSEQSRPRVGVGVMIWKDGKILLGKRKSKQGTGEYQFPGGHLELGEKVETCAAREVLEECGLVVKNLRFQFVANVFTPYAPLHYVHFGMEADWASGEPVACEPEKCEDWQWFDPKTPPVNLFYYCELALHSVVTKKKFYEDGDVEPGFRLS